MYVYMCLYITEGEKTNKQYTKNGTSAASHTSSHPHICNVYRNFGKYHAMETTINSIISSFFTGEK